MKGICAAVAERERGLEEWQSVDRYWQLGIRGHQWC